MNSPSSSPELKHQPSPKMIVRSRMETDHPKIDPNNYSAEFSDYGSDLNGINNEEMRERYRI